MKMLEALITRVRNETFNTVREQADYLFKLIRSNNELYTEIADRLIHEQCMNILRSEANKFNHLIQGKANPATISKNVRMQEIAVSQNLTIAARALTIRFMNMTILGGTVKIRDAHRGQLERQYEIHEEHVKGNSQKAKWLKMIINKLPDDKTQVYRVVSEADLKRFHELSLK